MATAVFQTATCFRLKCGIAARTSSRRRHGYRLQALGRAGTSPAGTRTKAEETPRAKVSAGRRRRDTAQRRLGLTQFPGTTEERTGVRVNRPCEDDIF